MNTDPMQHRESIWETDVFPDSFDVLVVGSGLVGLNAAISLIERAPALRVAVADRWYYPLGASTRNAGFATFGSLSELASDIRERGLDACLELIEQRWKGLQVLHKRVPAASMDYQVHGGFEIFRDEDTEFWEQSAAMIDELNRHLNEIIGQDGRFQVLDTRSRGKAIRHLVSCPAEGYLHPGKLVRYLAAMAQSSGITFFRPFSVVDWVRDSGMVRVQSAEGYSLTCKHLLFATNGFASRLLPDLDVQPARNQVLLTEVIPGLEWKGGYHSHAGFFYFRDYAGRILIGGARNHDPEGETTAEFGFSQPVQDALKGYLTKVVMEGREVRIDRSWSGIMGVGKEKRPIVRRISEGVYCAVRLGGMGVAIGSRVGQDAAELVLQEV